MQLRLPNPSSTSASRLLLESLAAACLLLTAAPAAADVSGKLGARPDPAAALAFAPGVTELSNDALLYRPASLGDPPYPLIVTVHGYPGTSKLFLDWFKGTAEAEGAVLVSLQSRSARWDLVPDPSQTLNSRFKPSFEFGPDIPRIDEVLREVFAGAPVDPKRVMILGFSDGGSYSLSLGLTNYELFTAIVSLSPGFVRIPTEVLPSQRIVVASGKLDRVLAYDVVALKIVPLLRENRLKPRFCSFDGGHAVHLRLTRDAVRYGFGRPPLDQSEGRPSRTAYRCVSH